MKTILVALALVVVGCDASGTPSPFRPEDNVVPAPLAPDRPRPPPPSALEVKRVPRAPLRQH